MARQALTGGAYEARSVIAAAQRQLNLYAEPMPAAQGEPAPYAYYPMPGLRLLGQAPAFGWRGIRQCSNGRVYGVVADQVFVIDPTSTPWGFTRIGAIRSGITTPVGMMDNGIQCMIVDGSPDGWTIEIGTNVFAKIDDPTGAFRGGTHVDFLDTYFLLDVPGTPQFQASNSLSTTFDPLFFANKSAYADILMALVVAKRQIWLIGNRTTEPFYDAGAADFPFQSMPGVFMDHGTIAPYSAATIDGYVLWLSHDRFGQRIVLQGGGEAVKRISTYAIEAELTGYSTVADAIGFCYEMSGHRFYVLNFPTADKTWCFDLSTGLVMELAWMDSNGLEHRHRANCVYLVNETVVCGDWQNQNLYALELSAQDDNGQPIKRQRSFPHLVADGKRVFYRQFIADMQVAVPSIGALSLDWSDDRGVSYGNPVVQGLGAHGEYRTSVQFQRLGMARDRVHRLTWQTPHALQGAFIEATPAGS